MKVSVLSTLVLGSLATSVLAATSSCDANNKCPKDFPCCNGDGICGTGESCFGGCDPRFSYSPGACVPMPVCVNSTVNFTGTDDIVDYTKYLGDATKYNWTYTGTVNYTDNELRVTMPDNSTGTVMSSTHYIWYGKVTAYFKSSHDQGVVSDFILYSNVKDEIDYEFLGTKLEAPQSNYYWQGALNYSNEISGSTSDTYENYHSYTIDWQEDSISWAIDGSVFRTLKKSDTYNSTSDTYQFPQTPSRIQFSIWPVTSSAGEGTQEWAGGAIDWDVSDMSDPGYFYAAVQGISIECYDAPSGTNSTGSKSYVYNSDSGLEGSVAITDDDTTMDNMGDSYLNPSEGASTTSSTKSATSTKSIANASEVSESSSKATSKTTSSSSKSIANASEVSESSSGATASATASGSDDSGASATATATATGSGSDSGSDSSSSASSTDDGGFVIASSAAASTSSSSSSSTGSHVSLTGVTASLLTGLSAVAALMFFM